MIQPDVITLDNKQFKKMKSMLKKLADTMVVDELAFCVIFPDPKMKPAIVLHERTKKMSKEHMNVIIAHELAHINGVIGEEDADIWALDGFTNKVERDILIDNWNHRHGHEYKGDK